MKKVILIVGLLFTGMCYTQEVQEIHQRAEIHFNSITELQDLLHLGIPIDHGVRIDQNYVLSDFSVSELNRARTAGFKVNVLIPDSKAYFLANNTIPGRMQNQGYCEDFYETPVNFKYGSMGGYYTYQEYLDELDLMFAMYPNIITEAENIGTFLTNGTPDASTTPPIGGNGIKWVKISDQPNSQNSTEPKLLYNSIHHAREPTSLSQLLFFMWYLLENYETDLEIRNIVDNTELFFIPVVNPDGYLYNEKTDPMGGGFWRKNRFDTNGVDLNRNYDYYIDGDPNNNIWGGIGTSDDPTSNIYRGTGPFSEVESQAVKWFCEQHEFILGLNNHSFGDGIFFPYGYLPEAFTPEHELYLSFLDELTSKNGYFFAKTNGLAGTANDFMYGTVGTHNRIFSITPEIGDQFWLPASEIIAVCKDMMYLNITSAKMANSTPNLIDESSDYVGNQGNLNFDFDIQHLGLNVLGNYTVGMAPISPNILWHAGPVTVSNMEPMAQTSASINYVVAGGTEAGEDIIFDLIVNNGSFNSRHRFEKKFGQEQTILFDQGDDITTNFEPTSWGETTEDFVSPPTSFTDSPFGEYTGNADTEIRLSNEIDLSAAAGASVSFFTKFDLNVYEDYVQFEVSTDGGATWEPQCGRITREGNIPMAPEEGQPIYEGVQDDWIQEYIDLSDYVGESILLRFRLISSPILQRDGFYFDDLEVNIVNAETLGITDGVQSEFTLYPNPVEDVLNIHTNLNAYNIELYNVQGQLLYESIHSGTAFQFNMEIYPSGMYLLRLTSEGNSETFKLVKR